MFNKIETRMCVNGMMIVYLKMLLASTILALFTSLHTKFKVYISNYNIFIFILMPLYNADA